MFTASPFSEFALDMLTMELAIEHKFNATRVAEDLANTWTAPELGPTDERKELYARSAAEANTQNGICETASQQAIHSPILVSFDVCGILKTKLMELERIHTSGDSGGGVGGGKGHKGQGKGSQQCEQDLEPSVAAGA